MIRCRRDLLAVAALVASLACPVARGDSTVVFNEVMYHPATNEAQLEWLELHNQMAIDMDISGWSLGNGVFLTFPDGTIVPGGGFVVIAIDPDALAAATGFTGAYGPFEGRLDNSGERLELLNNSGRVMDSMRFRDAGAWPVAADGSGVSLAKINPDAASSPARNWAWSSRVGGTPGEHNFPEANDIPAGPQGLVSYWSFDGSGNVARDPLGGNDGSPGDTTTRIAGIVGDGAYSFDNSVDAFINVGSGTGNNFSVTAGITVEALFVSRWTAAAGDQEMIFRKEDGDDRVLLGFQNDGNDDGRSDPPLGGYAGPVLSFGINVRGVYGELDMPLDGQDGRPTTADIADGQPHHVAATYDRSSGVKAIFLDGVRVYSTDLGGGGRVSSGGASSAYIGNMTGRRQPFTGTIDEVAFWSRALEPDEIIAHVAAFRAGRDYFSTTVDGPGASGLAFNEYLVVAANDFWVELTNRGDAPVRLGGHVIANGTLRGQHILGTGQLAPGAHLVLTRDDLGFDLLINDKLFLYSPDRLTVIDAIALEERHEGRHPDGAGEWRFPDEPTPGAANRVTLRDEIVINEIMYHQRPEAEEPPVFEETRLLPIDAVWRYNASGDDLGTAWRQPGFDDSGWPSGQALFHNESSALPAPKNTPLDLGPVTFYFRATFELPRDPQGGEIQLRPVIDDGAVFYLNGVEVHRLNMRDGPVDAATLASPGVANATFTGPFSIPTASLRRGTNVIAVEVHQASAGSSDVVFGTEVISAILVSEGHPFRESPEAWVELFNRGDSAVDLGGWEIDRGIDYTFEDGTVLAPGEYLVIAADSRFLASKYPGARIVGDFEGRLSNRTDRIVLLDDRGNPADEVRYADNGRWPIHADGGGSSLELRDPRSDNSRGEAWAASDETGKSSWRSYRYSGPATQAVGPTQWREFVIGLLDAGEALVDDMSVIESPSGARRELLQNGDFEAGEDSWRILGTHRHSRVISDPDDPANRVLHLVATDATEHMHNHLETTLVGNTAIVNGREYEISFRARWLTGSNQLNTRLYFNRLPRTTLLEVPAKTGTPGARNSTFEENAGPTFDDFHHTPAVPAAGEPVTVSVIAGDPDGVASVALWWSVAGGAWQRGDMTPAGDVAGRFTGTIPGQSASRIVQFYVEGRDTPGAVATFPARGRDSRALYKVDDGQARSGPLHNFRIVMTTEDTNFLHLDTNVMSNERLGGTVISREREVFYDVGVRLKGSQRGRPGGSRVSFSVQFHSERPFRGVHRTVSLDRSGGWGIGAGPHGQDEIIFKHGVNHAGGLPGMYDDMAWLIAPRSAQNGPTLVMMAKYSSVFLDSQYPPNGSDGTLYKNELIYYPTTTVNGNPESLKRPLPDVVVGTDLRDLGDDKEAYRWTFLLENNLDRDDYSRFIELCKTLGLSAGALDSRIDDILDVDESTRMYAVHSLCGISDTYWYAGNHHNIIFYENPIDGRFRVFHWDNDVAYTRGVSSSHWGNVNLAKVYQIPRYRRLFYLHLRDLVRSTFNLEYITRWTSYYGALAQETASFGRVRSYIGQRASWTMSNLPRQVPFEIVTNSGDSFTVDELRTTIEGSGWIDVRTILVAEREEPPQVTWPADSRWRAEVRLFSGDNELTFLAFDIDGTLVGSDGITVHSTAGFEQAVISSVTPREAAAGEVITITGENFHDGITVYFGDERSPEVAFDAAADPRTVMAVVPEMPIGTHDLRVRNIDGRFSEPVAFTVVAPAGRFVRGDANRDGVIDVSDVVKILVHLFRGVAIDCNDAADANDSESLDVSDAIFLLDYLFRSGSRPPPPHPGTGVDPTGDESLDCAS